MKTKVLTIAAVMIMALVTTQKSANANTVKTIGEVSTILTNISTINKIEVHGNVELFVSDGTADQVKVYNKYYAENALIQGKDGVLRIASYKNEKLVVWVTAADLRAIAAYDNAEVKSFGNLSKIELDVQLYNNATASLKLDAYKACISVNDSAKATITGSADDCTLTYIDAANINHKGFVALNSTTTKIGYPSAISKGNQLAGL